LGIAAVALDRRPSDAGHRILNTLPGRGHTVVGGRLIVDKGEILTLDIAPVIHEHNRNTARLAALCV
jgi:hypothetical protein